MSKFIFFISAVLLFLLGLVRFGYSPETMAFCATGWILITFLFFDLRYWYVPRKFALISIMLSLGIGALGVSVSFFERVLGAVSGFIFLYCFLIVSTWLLRSTDKLRLDEYALGFGDPIILAVIGSSLGCRSLPAVLFFGSLQGLFTHLSLRLLGSSAFRPDWSPQDRHIVPFGTFLCLAGVELMAWPDLPRIFSGLFQY